MWTQIINIAAGLVIMVIPYLLGYDKELSTHNYITGPLILTFAITAIWEVNRNARWLNIPVAAWLIISSILYGNDQTIYPNLIAGVFVIIFFAIKRRGKGIYGGGWRSLFQKNPTHIQQANSNA